MEAVEDEVVEDELVPPTSAEPAEVPLPAAPLTQRLNDLAFDLTTGDAAA